MFRIANYDVEFANLEQWPNIVPVIAVIATLTIWLYATERRLVSWRVGLLLTALRLGVVAVLTAALLDLRIREADSASEQLRRTVIIAVDASWSMDVAEQPLNDLQRYRLADATGQLAAGQRPLRIDDLAAMTRYLADSLSHTTETLAELAEALRGEGARLDGPHPLATAAADRLRLTGALYGYLSTRLSALVPADSSTATVPQSIRAGLILGRDGPLQRAGEVLTRLGRLPLSAQAMQERVAQTNLAALAGSYQDALATSALGELRNALTALADTWSALADELDTAQLEQNRLALADTLAQIGQTTRRELVRKILARDNAAQTAQLESRYRLRFLIFDRDALEFDATTARAQIERPPAAPVTFEQLAAFQLARAGRSSATAMAKPDQPPPTASTTNLKSAAPAASGDPLSAAFSDFETLLRSAARGQVPTVVAGLVVFSDGINNPAPPAAGGRRPVGGGLATTASRLGFPVIGVAPTAAATSLQDSGDPTLPMASPRGPRDVRIARLAIPRTITRRTQVELVADIACLNIPAGTPLTVTLLDGGQPAADGPRLVQAAELVSVAFKIPTDQVGLRNFTVQVEPVADEIVQTNNRASVSAIITDSKLRVLLVSEEPGWEWKFLKDTLERDRERIELDSVILRPGLLAGANQTDASGQVRPWGEFPQTPEDLARYDVVILGDLDPRGRFFRDENYLTHLSRYVRDRGGSVVVCPGRWYLAARATLSAEVRETFEELLPVTLPGLDDPEVRRAADASASEPFAVVPSTEGRDHVICRLAGPTEDNQAVWRAFPPHYWRLPVADTKPGATVLLTVEPTGEAGRQSSPPTAAPSPTSLEDVTRRMPILVHHRSGLGRVITVALQTTWRLRFKVGDPYHGRFWGQLVRWAAPATYPVGNDYVQLRSERLTYRAGEAVPVEVRFTDRQGRPIDPTTIQPEVVVFEGDPLLGIVAQRVALSPVGGAPGLWRAECLQLRDGRFTLMPRLGAGDSLPQAGWQLPDQGLTIEVGQVGLQQAALPPEAEAELARLARDPTDPSDALTVMANASGGLSLDLTTLPALGTILEALEKPIDHLKRRAEETGPRWGLWLLLAAFTVLLSAEWLIRKSVGLI